jgi:NAD+ kinase
MSTGCAPRVATVFTHRQAQGTSHAVRRLITRAGTAGVVLRFDERETAKHHLAQQDGIVVNALLRSDADLCLVLGGDGTILHALRAYAGTGVPVFAVNFGAVGFLATGERQDMDASLERAFTGDFEVLMLPGIDVGDGMRGRTAVNDVSLHRAAGKRVAELAYGVGSDEVGRVRCDGLVCATPAGSTGYNLANGGPVMAWGVEGIVVSFIAPHSLTARPLVVAPDDTLVLHNCSAADACEVTVDGRPVFDLGAGEVVHVRFRRGCSALAQLPGASFYHRLRQKFGRLAT